MKTGTTTDYDIVIVGGGLVGSSLACALAGTPCSVLVADSGPAQTGVEKQYDIRVSAITGASRNFFSFIGTWEIMQGMRTGQVRQMEIWDEGGKGSLHLDAAQTGEACLAHIIENSVIRAALYERLKTLANVRYLEQTQVTFGSFAEDHVQLTVNGEQIRTRLLVGADGARSAVRDWAQIPCSGWSFDQTAIVATVRTELPHDFTAYQRFLQTGPLAFLPLDDMHTSSIVWSADTGRANELAELPDAAFIAQLEQAFEHRLGAIELLSDRAGFPLSLMHVERTVEHRVVLVGDAAHRVHPLAGQGLNLGLADVAALAELVSAGGLDVGAERTLRRYERWRASDTRMMVMMMDLFKRLFGSTQPVLKGLRNFGMDLVDADNTVQGLIMSFASGTGGDVPTSLKQGGSK